MKLDMKLYNGIIGPETVYPVTVDHGGVTGVVAVTFTDHGHVYVHVKAHVNDDLEALTYRGEGYLASLHAYVDSKGAWHESHRHTTRRANWSDAPRTYADKIMAALLRVAQDTYVSHPDAVAAGELRQARIELDHAARDVADLEPKIKEARAKLRAARKRLADASE